MYLGDGLEQERENLSGEQVFSGVERKSWNLKECKEGKVRQGEDV